MFFKNVPKALLCLSVALSSFTNLYSQDISSERKKQIEESIYVSNDKNLSDELLLKKQDNKNAMAQANDYCKQNRDNTILSNYFNTILNKIISSNQHILPENKKDFSDFCILVKENITPVPGFSDYGDGLIILTINFDFLDVLSKV